MQVRSITTTGRLPVLKEAVRRGLFLLPEPDCGCVIREGRRLRYDPNLPPAPLTRRIKLAMGDRQWVGSASKVIEPALVTAEALGFELEERLGPLEVDGRTLYYDPLDEGVGADVARIMRQWYTAGVVRVGLDGVIRDWWFDPVVWAEVTGTSESPVGLHYGHALPPELVPIAREVLAHARRRTWFRYPDDVARARISRALGIRLRSTHTVSVIRRGDDVLIAASLPEQARAESGIA